MLISHRYKFIFVHVQKTGGTSITAALAKYCDESDFEFLRRHNLDQHAYASDAIRVLGRETWDSYFTFAFERNPWDKCLSLYYYQLQNWSVYRKPFRPQRPTFQQWFYPFGMMVKKLTPSIDMYSHKGEICVDFVGRFERLREDFAEVCQRIGLPPTELPQENKSELRESRGYREHFSPPMRKRIERIYRREIEAFGYSF